MMRVRVGHEITISTTQNTPLICLVATHVSRQADLVFPELVMTDPQVPVHGYYDGYGNICRRLTAPAGRFTLSGDATLFSTDQPDPWDYDAQEWPVAVLPDDVVQFLTGSRYVETDLLSQEAWNRFGGLNAGWRRVQAVVDHVHDHIRFDYQQARSTRTAADANREQVGVCRDFAHLALGFIRALNIPARYVNGYVGDIGIPQVPDPMDFAAWIEVFLGGRWWTFDPRNNQRRIGRVVVARGHDAADVPLMNSFGQHNLDVFKVWCHVVDDHGNAQDGSLFGQARDR